MAKDSELAAVRAAKDKARAVFGRLGHVCGVGITHKEGHYAVQVNLEDALAADQQCPSEIDGVPLVVRVVGRISKQDG